MFRRKEENPAETAVAGGERVQQTSMNVEQPMGSLRQRTAPSLTRTIEESGLLRKPAPGRDLSAREARAAALTGRFERAATRQQEPAMRMPMVNKEPLPSPAAQTSPTQASPALEELKQSVAERVARPQASVSRSGAETEKRAPEKRVLTVGQDTVLKGEIATCDRLIVEGTVDAVLSDVHTIQIEESGMFKGAATVEDAEISGQFDGDLEVRGRLIIYATGRVTGKVSYSTIEIHRGGMITGKVMLAGTPGSANTSRSKQESLLKEERQPAKERADGAVPAV